MTALPTAAARAAQKTRWRKVQEAIEAETICIDRGRWERVRRAAEASFVVYDWDNDELRGEAESAWCALESDDLSTRNVRRHLPRSARQGQVRDVAEGDSAYPEEQGR